MNQHTPVPFIDLAAQRQRLGASIDDAVARVLNHCQFINGPEVTKLEAELANPQSDGKLFADSIKKFCFTPHFSFKF